MRVRFLTAATLAVCSPVFAAPAAINFKTINDVFKGIAAEVVKATQDKNEAGNDLISGLSVSFDEKKTDLAKGAVAVNATVAVSSSLWSKGKPSSIALDLASSTKDDTDGTRLMLVDARLGVKTDTVALIRYATQRYLKQSEPCTDDGIARAADPLEEKFNRDACVDLQKMPASKTVGQFLDLVRAILDKRLAYVDARLKELETTNDKNREEALKSERKYDVKARDALAAKRANPDELALTLNEDIGVTGTQTKAVALSVALSPTAATVGVSISSAEAAGYFDSSRKEIEELARTLSLDDADPAKQASVKSLREQFEFLVEMAKNILLVE